MIRGGFLSAEDRKTLIALARDGSGLARVTRRSACLVRGWRLAYRDEYLRRGLLDEWRDQVFTALFCLCDC
jgi:hypothetical protein